MTRRSSSSSRTVWSATDLSGDPHKTADKARRIQAMFEAIAHRYDLNNKLHSLGRDRVWRCRAVRLCDVRPTDRVLDVACGTGELTEAFADAGPAAVVGVDFTEAMLQIARDKASRQQRAEGAAAPVYQHADAMALPFDDGSFDIVSIAFGIRNIADAQAALEEFRRVLRGGGRLLILEFSRVENRLLRAVIGLYCDRIMPRTASWLAGDRSGAYRYLPRSVKTFVDREQMVKLMAGAGFMSISEHPMSFGICTAYLGRAAD